MAPSRGVVTRGYSAFSWYLRVSMALAVLAIAPLIMLYLAFGALLGAVHRSSQRVRGVSSVKSGCVFKRPFCSLLGHNAAQFFAYWHVFASNVVFFTLLTAAVLKIASPAMTVSAAFKAAALASLGPACVLCVMSVAYYSFSRFFRSSSRLLMEYCTRLQVHDHEVGRDGFKDSVLDLMLRDQVEGYSSMSSLSRHDKQLLFGVPTTLVAICCYEYDLCTGQEREIRDVTEQCRDRFGG